jgi:hypothetical protein
MYSVKITLVGVLLIIHLNRVSTHHSDASFPMHSFLNMEYVLCSISDVAHDVGACVNIPDDKSSLRLKIWSRSCSRGQGGVG